jgi:hypothetical protein
MANPPRPAIDAVAMARPEPCRLKCGATARKVLKMPPRLTSSISCQVSSVISATSPQEKIPALASA